MCVFVCIIHLFVDDDDDDDNDNDNDVRARESSPAVAGRMHVIRLAFSRSHNT